MGISPDDLDKMEMYKRVRVTRMLAYSGADSTQTWHRDNDPSSAHGEDGGLFLLKINSSFSRKEDDVALPIDASFSGGLLQIVDPRVNEHHENEGFTAKHKGEGRGGERDIGFTIIIAHDYKAETIPPGIGVHIVDRVFGEDIELGGVEPLTREGMQDPNLKLKFNWGGEK
ncbi:hypothetical protein TrRE_jg1498, partial [Triparma retinervis]